jgi:exodeoxyribonuclease-3
LVGVLAARRRPRLDHLLPSPALAPRLTKAGVDRDIRGEEAASDNAPA